MATAACVRDDDDEDESDADDEDEHDDDEVDESDDGDDGGSCEAAFTTDPAPFVVTLGAVAAPVGVVTFPDSNSSSVIDDIL